MDYEDYMPEDFDPEYVRFDVAMSDPWDGVIESEWDPYGDWVYEGEYTDEYDQY